MFERKVRDLFASHGYVVVRSTVSKSPADLVVLATEQADDILHETGFALAAKPLLVQAKIGGRLRLGPAEWNELYRLAKSSGCWPVLATQEKEGRRHVVRLWSLTGTRVSGAREWPMRALTFPEVPDAP